nr:YhfC family intramembrane metalloprotease [Propionibacterium sp.]
MVAVSSIVAMAVTLVVCFALPLGGLLLVRRRHPRVGRAFACGALAFFVAQVATRLPLMALVVPGLPDPARSVLQSIPGASFSAGLFEETGRLVVMLLLMKAFHRLADGVAFGLGHGGLEAVLIVGLTMVNNIVLAVLINTGGWASIAAALPAGQAAAVERALTETGWDAFALAGVERVGAIGLHIACSLVILAGIVHHRKLLAWAAAVALHGLANLGVISAAQAGWPAAAIEFGFVVLIAGLLWALVRRLGPTLPDAVGAAPAPG